MAILPETAATTALPCPFCGGKGLLDRDDTLEDRVTFAVICESCASQGPWRKTGESGEVTAASSAVFAWNQRRVLA